MAGNREAVARNEIDNYLGRHKVGAEKNAILGNIEAARNRFGEHHLGVAMALDVHPSIIGTATEALSGNVAKARQAIEAHGAKGWTPAAITKAKKALMEISTQASNAKPKK
ncbi:MAG: hypothetical protein WCX64_05845 [Candidatus Micrarchaeia archaeon]